MAGAADPAQAAAARPDARRQASGWPEKLCPGSAGLDLYSARRLLTAFEAPERCVLLLVVLTARPEVTDRMLVFGERHLRLVLA